MKKNVEGFILTESFGIQARR